MASFNTVVVMGNLTRDVELRYIPSGTAVTDISLAVNEKRKGQGGEYIEEVSYVDVTLWGRTAEIASEYLGKGKSVLIHGRLKQERWEKDGAKHSKLKVICERLVLLSSGGRRDSGQDEHEETANHNAGNYSSHDQYDDIPF